MCFAYCYAILLLKIGTSGKLTVTNNQLSRSAFCSETVSIERDDEIKDFGSLRSEERKIGVLAVSAKWPVRRFNSGSVGDGKAELLSCE